MFQHKCCSNCQNKKSYCFNLEQFEHYTASLLYYTRTENLGFIFGNWIISILKLKCSGTMDFRYFNLTLLKRLESCSLRITHSVQLVLRKQNQDIASSKSPRNIRWCQSYVKSAAQ